MKSWTAATSPCIRPLRRCPARRPPAPPVGERESVRRAGAAAAPARDLRKRIGSALAAIAALVVEVLRGDQGRAAAAAEAQAADDVGHGARLGRRLQPVLGLAVRGRLRRAAVRARDGPRDPAAPRGHQGQRADVHPVPRRRRLRRSRSATTRWPRRASGLAGPILGTLGAAAALAIAGARPAATLLRALAYVGFFINLFNLLPVVPLDGGRAMAAMAPWMWFVGFGALVALRAVASTTRSC